MAASASEKELPGEPVLSTESQTRRFVVGIGGEYYQLSSDANIELSGVGLFVGGRAALSDFAAAGVSMGQAYSQSDGAAVYTSFVITGEVAPFGGLQLRRAELRDNGWPVARLVQVEPLRWVVGASLIQFYLNGLSGVVSASGFGLSTRVDVSLGSLLSRWSSSENLSGVSLGIGSAIDRLQASQSSLIRFRVTGGLSYQF